jgi:uncharacterized protein YndB with AHSA1/START domain
VDATADSTTVERRIEIAASPETVWELLTDPEEATRWMGQWASFDLRPGGEYRVDVLPGNVARGEFVEIEPPRRLIFTWGWDPGTASALPPGSTTIEFELIPNGDGTLVRFTHRGLPTADEAESHRHGWDHYLGRLARAASGRDPGVDPWIDGPMA